MDVFPENACAGETLSPGHATRFAPGESGSEGALGVLVAAGFGVLVGAGVGVFVGVAAGAAGVFVAPAAPLDGGTGGVPGAAVVDGRGVGVLVGTNGVGVAVCCPPAGWPPPLPWFTVGVAVGGTLVGVAVGCTGVGVFVGNGVLVGGNGVLVGSVPPPLPPSPPPPPPVPSLVVPNVVAQYQPYCDPAR